MANPLASECDQSRGTSGGWAPTIQFAICDDKGTPDHQPDVAETQQPVVAKYISEDEQSITDNAMSWPVCSTVEIS